ncbi:MAG: Tm-1-like ATP-binding domain-containing protein [Planctomycetota bacterium]|nr:Tm-1-like ATP-binding domain-containing protein [Planctomycetota bacterium]
MSVFLLTTLDTKGREAAFVRERLRAAGVDVKVVDTGCLGEPAFPADVSREDVFRAANTSLEAMLALGDRGEAVTRAARGAAALIKNRHEAGVLSGVLGIGGGAGTTIGTAAMRELPIGVPKLMVSTLASGEVGHFVGSKDVLMMNSVVDILGLNRISRAVLTRAAQAMAGMVAGGPVNMGEAAKGAGDDRPLVAATMFGVTTPCVERAREVLEEAGYEVLVFHATGAGGRTLESLADEGLLAGVLDITTTELADELVGGYLTAGPERLTAAGRRGVPQLVSVGATDMVNFHGIDTVPERFRNRRLYKHNENVTLMRTTAEECAAIGRDIGRKVEEATGPTAVLLPLRGVSAIDREGQPFDDPEARAALFSSLRASAGDVEIVELDRHVNDPDFAEAAARKLIELMEAKTR